MSERPDGSQSTIFGWVLIAVGVIAAFIGGNAESVNGLVWGAIIANLGIGLGIVLVSLGYLVRAIWFLPGREEEIKNLEREQSLPLSKMSDTRDSVDCSWCGLKVFEPSIACSKQSNEELKEELALIEPDSIPAACQSQLIAKGYISE